MDFKRGYKYFLDFLIGLAFISLNVVHQSAHAKDLFDLSELSKSSASEVDKYSFGMDGIYTFVGARSDYGKIFRSSKPGSNFYIGYNLESIMLEIGYLSTTRRSKESVLSTGDTFLGTTLDAPKKFNGQVRFRNTHFDLNFFTNFYDKLSIVSAIGISFVRPNVTFTATNREGNSVTFKQIVTKTNTIARAGVGIRYLLGSNSAIRAMGYFEQYSKIRFRDPGEPNNKPFKDAYTISVGILFRI